MARIAKKGSARTAPRAKKIKPEYQDLIDAVSGLEADQWWVVDVPEGTAQSTFRNRIAMVLRRRLPDIPVRVYSLDCGDEIAVELR